MRCFQSFLGVLKLVSPNDSRLATLEISLSTLDSRLSAIAPPRFKHIASVNYYDVSDHRNYRAVYMKLNLYFFAKGGLFDMNLKRYDLTPGAGMLG